MNFFIYARQSLSVEQGESIENQIEYCRQKIKLIEPNVLPGDIFIYSDEGFSGKNINRPGFQRMMQDLKTKKPQFVLCYMLDRVSRSVCDFAIFLSKLNGLNISFVSVKQNFDTSTPNGRAMLHVISAFAQYERDMIAERVKDNMLMLARTGIWLGGTRPFGFNSERSTKILIDGKIKEYSFLKPNEDIKIIKLIFEIFLKTGSLAEVSHYLFKENILTSNQKNFTPTGIKKIIENPVYCTADKFSYSYFKNLGCGVCFNEKDFDKGLGLRVFNRGAGCVKAVSNPLKWVVALSKHKGVISGESWVAAQGMFKETTNTKVRQTPALLSGLIKCLHCGESLHIRLNSRNKNYYYVCARKSRFGKDACVCKNLIGAATDKFVLEYIEKFNIEKFKSSFDTQKLNQAAEKFSGAVLELEKKIKKLESKRNNIFKHLANDDGSSFFETAKAQVNKINAQIRNLSQQLIISKNKLECSEHEKANIAQVISVFKDFQKNHKTFTFRTKKSLLRLIVDKLTWDSKDLKIFLVEKK